MTAIASASTSTAASAKPQLDMEFGATKFTSITDIALPVRGSFVVPTANAATVVGGIAKLATEAAALANTKSAFNEPVMQALDGAMTRVSFEGVLSGTSFGVGATVGATLAQLAGPFEVRVTAAGPFPQAGTSTLSN